VKGFLTPLVGVAAGSKGEFSARTFTIVKTTFPYGAFVNGLIAFLLTAVALYYLVVLPSTKLTQRFRPNQDEAMKRDCPECLSSIPAHAKRCAYCTVVLDDPAPAPVPLADERHDPR